MPNLGELASYLVGLVTDAIGSSSMRLGAAPTVTILVVLLVFLSLIARPGPRWTATGLGGLARVGRVLALAAESGADASFSLGSAGIGRAASATERFQTLAALPLLGHVADAAARAGIPLRVTTNDPVAGMLAQATLSGAHRRTATPERATAAAVVFVGEGRAAAAASALATAGAHGVAAVAGGLAEDALLLLDGVLGDAEWSLGATASASEVAGPLLDGDGSLIGPELLQAAGELASAGHARTAVLAANRLIWGAIGLLLAGSLMMWAGGPQVAAFLTGR